MLADLGEHDQRGVRADAGQRGQDLHPRVRLRAGAHLAVDPLDQRGESGR